MLEKFTLRFDQQKSDNAFVEAATNASARRATIDRLVKTRAIMFPLLLIIMVLSVFGLLLVLFDPTSASRTQTLSNGNQGLVIVFTLITYMSIDLQIKFLKTLEAGAQQAAPADKERE